MYYECSVGIGEWIVAELHCPPGLFFDPDLLVCSPSDSILACQGETTTTTTVDPGKPLELKMLSISD